MRRPLSAAGAPAAVLPPAAPAVRKLAAEFTGTAFLLLAIVGSGITASAGGSPPSRLFQHAVVVGATLAALIATFGRVSGAHLNPAVTLGAVLLGDIRPRLAAAYAFAQVGGGALGVVLANVMFSLPPVALASTDRTGLALGLSEGLATFGLVLVVAGTLRSGRPGAVAPAVGAYIAAAIYFTSSTSFANPAVTLARVLSDTDTGIGPVAVPGFLVAQIAGALMAAALAGWLHARPVTGGRPGGDPGRDDPRSPDG